LVQPKAKGGSGSWHRWQAEFEERFHLESDEQRKIER
jgi:hypothetical protein